MTPEQQQLLTEWQGKVRRAQIAHYAAANRCDRRQRYLGVPVITFSAITGATIFADVSDKRLFLAIGVASVATAILAGLQTFLQLPDRAEKHRAAAQRYGDLKRQCDAVLANAPTPADGAIDSIRIQWDAANKSSPLAVSSIWVRQSQ